MTPEEGKESEDPLEMNTLGSCREGPRMRTGKMTGRRTWRRKRFPRGAEDRKAEGTGASIGAFLAAEGKDVTFMARGAHLEAMRKNGLVLDSGLKGHMEIKNVKV